MRKTITGTGGMLLLQTLKDAGVEYLFTNPGSAETGIFAALAESEEQRLVVGKHEGLVAAMADGYRRLRRRPLGAQLDEQAADPHADHLAPIVRAAHEV